MKELKLALCALGLTALAPVAAHAAADDLVVAIRADNGYWLSRCEGCQTTVDNRYPTTVTVHTKGAPQNYNRLTVVKVGAKLAFKTDSGQFIARCAGCVAGGPDPLVLVADANPPATALFTPEWLANGKYGLKADNGKYLSRCTGCSPGATVADTVAVNGVNPTSEQNSQWSILPLTFPTGTNVAIQADNGTFVSRCDTCQAAVDPATAQMTLTIHVPGPPTAAHSQFQVTNVAGKIALKSDTGKFVARCRNCIAGATRPDSLTVMQANANSPTAQFTPVMLSNGLYGLKADTGLFLARCDTCSPGAKVQYTVTAHLTNPEAESPAQWNILWLK